MAEKEQAFVVTDRRKYRMDGNTLTPNPDHVPNPERDRESAPQQADSSAPSTASSQRTPSEPDRGVEEALAQTTKSPSRPERSGVEGPAVPVSQHASHAHEPAQKLAEAATLEYEPAGAEELVQPEPTQQATGFEDGDYAGYDEPGPYDVERTPATDAAGNPLAGMPPPPNAAETEAANRAYQQTTERLDDLIRANDLGGKREAPIDFSRVAQSFYVTAMMQLGFNTPPNQQIRVDLFGARQTIDMLAVVAEKTRGNLSADEGKLVQSMLFELRMGFLEMTQAVAQSAQAQQGAAGGRGSGGAPGAAATGGRVTPFPGPAKR